MSYLMSTGWTTESILQYIIDAIQLNFRLNKSTVPFNNTLGMNTELLDMDLDSFQSSLEVEITTTLDRFNSLYDTTLTIENLTYRDKQFFCNILIDNTLISENTLIKL